jgi:hypothetical protein
MSARDQLVPPETAVSTTDVRDATGEVLTWDVAILAEAGTTILAGCAATVGAELERVTTAPPGGAGAGRAMVPVTHLPPAPGTG